MAEQPQPPPQGRTGMDPEIGATLRHTLTQLVTLGTAFPTMSLLLAEAGSDVGLVSLALGGAGGVTLWRLFGLYLRDKSRRPLLYRVAIGLALGVTLGSLMAILVAWRGGGAGG